MKQVIVTIGKDGSQTTVETTGFSGAECLSEVGPLEAALGAATVEKKPEFYRGVRAPQAEQVKAQT